MQKVNLTLKSIKITNFKNISEIEMPLKKLNEVYGKNATGKSAILQAVQFALVGGKADVDKIKKGCDKAIVELEMYVGDTLLKVKTSINSEGNLYCKASSDGIKHSNPRSLIKKLITYGTFNPREMLDKKDRMQRILTLIPLKLKEEDLIIPGEDKHFPIHDKTLIDWDKHAFEVLKEIEKDMRNVRHSFYQRKDILQKAYQDMKDTYESNVLTFKTNYKTNFLEVEGYEKAVSKLEAFKAKNKHKQEEQDQLKLDIIKWEESITDRENKIAQTNIVLKGSREEQTRLTEQLNTARLAEKEMMMTIKHHQELIKTYKEELKVKREKISTADLDSSGLEKQVAMARTADDLQKQKLQINKKELEYEQAERYWKIQDTLIKEKIASI